MSYLNNVIPFLGECVSVISNNEIGVVMIGFSILLCVILSVKTLVNVW